MSATNVSMTAVYIVMGANDAPCSMQDLINRHPGEQEVNEILAGFAPKVERVYQSLKDAHDFGVWLYDVVQPFGQALVRALVNGANDEGAFRALISQAREACDETLTGAEIETARLAWNGTASPFAETYASAWISMEHVTPRTLDGLNALRDSDVLPFWISQTLYGYIVRFDALATYDLAEDETNSIVKRLATCDDMRAIASLLAAHGLQAAHLDADGPTIPGLQTFDH